MNAPPATNKPDSSDDFTVDGRDAIIGILRGLADHRVPLSGAFNNGVDVLLTAVVGVDPKHDAVYLDINANEDRNREMLNTRRVVFYAQFNGAKVMWTSTSVMDGTWDGYKAFRIPIPEKLQRIQRRGAYRVPTPVTQPAMCRIRLPQNRELLLPLFDICVEGIGVVLPDTPEPGIEKYAELKDCQIEHPDFGILPVEMKVQSIWEVTRKNGTKAQHAGLLFKNIKGVQQSVIQRFVYKMERQQIATKKKE